MTLPLAGVKVATNAERNRNRDLLIPEVEKIILERTKGEWIDRQADYALLLEQRLGLLLGHPHAKDLSHGSIPYSWLGFARPAF